MLQLSWPFNSPACFTRVPPLVTCQSRDPVLRLFLSAHILSFRHTLLLHNFHLNSGYLIAKLQENLAQKKANTWLNKFNLTFFFHEISFSKFPVSYLNKFLSWLVGYRKIVHGSFVITIYNSFVHGTYQYFVDSFLSLPIQVILKLIQMKASKKILLPNWQAI